ncbi:unnamed protein product [Nippostrongylus brasiliensis]|uniref:guanylate cyclase n=1 Tax=Nippostrongylus brasiliensis TaxID=27835 RepID=A0A0N4Y609_NIPBR|nr:unnamed protein product [Nippostrongylus brasiliensis]
MSVGPNSNESFQFGWIHQSFRQLVHQKYGNEVWQRIVEIAQFELGTESEVAHCYSDEDTLRLATSMANTIGGSINCPVQGIPLEEVWEAYGNFLIEYAMESGWNELLYALGYDVNPGFQGFLDSLDSLHYFVDHVIYKTKMRGPAFCCEAQQDGSLILHYYSIRYGIDNIVSPVRLPGASLASTWPKSKGEPVTYHTTMSIYAADSETGNRTSNAMVHVHEEFEAETTVAQSHWLFSPKKRHSTKTIKNALTNFKFLKSKGRKLSRRLIADRAHEQTDFRMSADDFCTAFPYHICFSTDLFIEHVGHFIRKAFPTINSKTNVCDIMEIVHPQVPLFFESDLIFPIFKEFLPYVQVQFSYESVLAFKNSHFIFQLKHTAEMAPALKNVKEPNFLKGPYIMQILLEFLRWPKLTQPIENPTDTSKGSKSVLSSRLSPYGLELFGEIVDLEHGSRLASWVCF